MITEVKSGGVSVSTSLRASSTGYPFKVVSMSGTTSDTEVYEARTRMCDLGYLREAYIRADGSTGYRCAAEPITDYERKGGSFEDTEGSTCLCNGLMSACGLGQVRSDGRREPPIVTSGDCVNDIANLLVDRDDYSASDVIKMLGADAASARPSVTT